MELWTNISFKLPDAATRRQLTPILESMAEEELGALLQERFAVFGERPSKALEKLMDRYPMDYLSISDLSIEEDAYHLHLVTASEGEDFIPDFMALLFMVGAEALDAILEGDEYGIHYWEEDGVIQAEDLDLEE